MVYTKWNMIVWTGWLKIYLQCWRGARRVIWGKWREKKKDVDKETSGRFPTMPNMLIYIYIYIYINTHTNRYISDLKYIITRRKQCFEASSILCWSQRFIKAFYLNNSISKRISIHVFNIASDTCKILQYEPGQCDTNIWHENKIW
jgi:hypothetical protein